MQPEVLGKKYDKIAQWWHVHHRDSGYGMAQLDRAIGYCKHRTSALDVGCGSDGRMISRLLRAGFEVSGVDVSEQMLAIARTNHPTVQFFHADISQWHSPRLYDLIVAWDSLFHLPLDRQVPVLTQLCGMLRPDGILLYTFGDAYGEHESDWHNDKFYYSTIGITNNLRVLLDNACECRHLELDQYPHPHVYLIAQKTQ